MKVFWLVLAVASFVLSLAQGSSGNHDAAAASGAATLAMLAHYKLSDR